MYELYSFYFHLLIHADIFYYFVAKIYKNNVGHPPPPAKNAGAHVVRTVVNRLSSYKLISKQRPICTWRIHTPLNKIIIGNNLKWNVVKKVYTICLSVCLSVLWSALNYLALIIMINYKLINGTKIETCCVSHAFIGCHVYIRLQ